MEAPDFHLQQLTANKVKAVVLLIQGMPKTRIAEEVGITRDTLYQWLKQPAFQTAMEVQQRRVAEALADPTTYQAGLVAWKAQLPEMMSALMDTASDPSNPRQARAAEIILQAVTPEKLNTGPTDDEKIIDSFLKSNNLAVLPQQSG